MRCRSLLAVGLCLSVLGVVSAPIDAQRAGAFRGSTDDPAIKYSTAPLNNARRRRQPEASGRRASAHVRRPQRIPAVGARGAADSGRFAAAGLLARQPAGTSRSTNRIPAPCSSTIASRSAGCAAATSSKWPRMTSPPASCSTRSNSAPTRAGPAAVQAGLHLPGLSHGRRYARRARPADVQHDTPESVAGIQPSASRRSDRFARATLWRLVRDRQHRLGDAHGQ